MIDDDGDVYLGMQKRLSKRAFFVTHLLIHMKRRCRFWYLDTDQKNRVIHAHKQDLMCGKQISDSIADFEILANKLK